MRCDCVERWDLRPFRRTLPQLHDDMGEQTLAGIEKAVGERPPGCPWRQLQRPFVAAVMNAHKWWSKSQLEVMLCGQLLPYALKRGLDVYDSALNSVQNYDARLDRERREREQREREMNNTPPIGGGRRRKR